MADLIDRQAAIDALGEKPLVWDDLSDFDLGKAAQWADDVDAIKDLLPYNQLATDCVSRQAVIDALLGITAMRNTIPLDSAIFNIKKLPSAQSEVVRCKDCKWFNRAGCAIKIVDESDNPTENDFCSFAERKEDE